MKKTFQESWQSWGTLILAAIIFTFLLEMFGMFSMLAHKSYDLRFRPCSPKIVNESPIVLLIINNQSFVSLKHKWPFPRSYFERLIKNLAKSGFASIFTDIEFSEASNTNPFSNLILPQVIHNLPRIILASKLVTDYGSYQAFNRYSLKILPDFISTGIQCLYACVCSEYNDLKIFSYTERTKRGVIIYENKKLSSIKHGAHCTGYNYATIQPAMVATDLDFRRRYS